VALIPTDYIATLFFIGLIGNEASRVDLVTIVIDWEELKKKYQERRHYYQVRTEDGGNSHLQL